MNPQLFNHLMSDGGRDHIMLAFQGAFSTAIHDSLLEMAEKRLARIPCEKSTRKKAFHLVVECLQNLCKYTTTTEPSEDEAQGILLLTLTDEGIRIATGNSVTAPEASILEQKLNALLKQDHSTLRKTYKERLVNGKMTELGGAGLGFIDIARKSGRTLDFDFAPLNNERLFFSLNVKVARDGRHTH